MKTNLNAMINILCFLIFVLAGCQPGSQANKQKQAAPHWERIGPGGGGSTFFPTFSYADPDVFLVRCDMTGSYLTKDGGNSYQQINFTGAASCYAFDPNDPEAIYVASSTLNRSSDGGKTWERIFPPENEIKSERFTGDHAALEIVTFDSTLYTGDNEISTVRIDPLDSKKLYFAMGSHFFFSSNSGETWEKKAMPQKIDYLYSNKNAFIDQIYIFSAGAIFIFHKASGKINRLEIPEAMTPACSFSAGEVKNTDQVIFYALHSLVQKEDPYAFNHCEVWTSADHGISWTKSNDSVLANRSSGIKPSLSSIVCSGFDAAQAYVVCNRYEEKKSDNTTLIWYGALKTGDGGKTWDWVWKGGGGTGQYGVQDAVDAENLTDAWVHKAFGGEFIMLIDAGVSPYDGNVAAVTDWYRTMKTTDGGKSWGEIYSEKQADGTFMSRGMDVTTTYGVHFDPFESSHIAISYTDIGYHDSYNGGKSWNRSADGVPAEWINTCYWVAFDPDIKGKMWSAWSGLHDFPRGKMTRNPAWKETGKGGICMSEDGGKTWLPSYQGMGFDSPSTSLVLDINSPPGSRTLYASVFNKGVFKSTDDGKSWEIKNNGIGENTNAFELTILNNGDLFLTVSAAPMHKNGKDGRDFYSGAVYKSTDGAETWTKLNISKEPIFPNGMDYDRQNPDRIYLACWADIDLADLIGGEVAKATGGNEVIDMEGGIFLSEDGGHTWTSVFDKDQYVYDVTVDPYHPGRVYCCTFNKAAYRSDDYGKTWGKIKGYDFHWGHRVVIDQNDPERIYITTFGSSVWHGNPEVE
ncbi:MAG: hypothetical protein V2B15_20855 [Bacteroidota bacterium]